MLRCLVCRKQCISLALLKEHVSKHIFNAPMYECRNCKQHFKDKISYLVHGKQGQLSSLCRHGYSYQNSFVCPLCGRRFPKKSTCVEHVRLHDKMVFNCIKCGWTFDTRYRVQVHEALRHGSAHVILPTAKNKSSREESNTTNNNNVCSLSLKDSGNVSTCATLMYRTLKPKMGMLNLLANPSSRRTAGRVHARFSKRYLLMNGNHM